MPVILIILYDLITQSYSLPMCFSILVCYGHVTRVKDQI